VNEPLDELYLVWLYAQVEDPNLKNPRRTFWGLCRALFTTEFVWFVPNDDARIEDGRELRFEFLMDAEIPEVDAHWIDQGVSYLEMLIALSRRGAFQDDKTVQAWFWLMIRNAGLYECNDSYNEDFINPLVEEVTTQITHRQYHMDGRGGLFPLKRPKEDQTKIELWYQMCAYIIENE
jgi:hypothetical protein